MALRCESRFRTWDNGGMQIMRTVLGAVMVLIVPVISFLDHVSRLDTLKTHYPDVYALITSPTFLIAIEVVGIGLLVAVLTEFRHRSRSRVRIGEAEVDGLVFKPFRLDANQLNKLGPPISPPESIPSGYLYQAWYERAIVIWSIYPAPGFYRLPDAEGARQLPFGTDWTWVEDAEWRTSSNPEWRNDAALRKRFEEQFQVKIPDGLYAPFAGEAFRWWKDPEAWRWIGWRKANTVFDDPEPGIPSPALPVCQKFKNGILIGGLVMTKDGPEAMKLILFYKDGDNHRGTWAFEPMNARAPKCKTPDQASGTRQIGEKNEPALVFDGYRAWRSARTFGVPFGKQYLTVVSVKNNQLASGKELHNVKACIDYLYNGTPDFTIEKTMWIEEHLVGPNQGTHDSWSVDLEANEAQCFPIYMRGDDLPFPQSGLKEGKASNDLRIGRWTARMTITADFCDPLKGEIEFTVLRQQETGKLIVDGTGSLGAMRLPIDNPNW